MDWLISFAVCLSAFHTALGFNIDPVAWRQLSSPAAGFGYKVVRQRRGLLVSAPLEQYSPNMRGQIYQCSTSGCVLLPLQAPKFAVNMSLGLTLTSDQSSHTALACGPTIPRDCKSITTYNGACWMINSNKQFGSPMPSSLQECPSRTDVAFLLDGSGSVSLQQFRIMKQFVKQVIGSLLREETKFAIIQFSSNTYIHYHFNQFKTSTNWENQIDGIKQKQRGTNTAKAIETVVNDVFVASRGSRPNAKKVLIVITDGESNDKAYLNTAAKQAESKGIIRFAIGVGNAFVTDGAKKELRKIASSPAEKHIFRPGSFESLETIRQSLQDQLFSIEGSQTGGDSLKLEMAQEGFSVAFVPEGGIQMSTVGAFEWGGSFQEYSAGGQMTSKPQMDMEPNSYLGYSMAVAKIKSGILTVVGAPRYKHRGVVMVFFDETRTIDPFPWQFQIGSYFGAEICAMDVDGDQKRYTDLILISAPMYRENDREGRVYICTFTGSIVDCQFEAPRMLRGVEDEFGRFGSSIAPLPDLNGDKFNDLAVGAPLENDGQGSIYIFHGEGRGTINPTYSQRIAASDVKRGLRFFGLSISQFFLDLSGDSLPDLAVGSKGNVILLRSKPILMVNTEVSFIPPQIPTTGTDCTSALKNTAQICFTITPESAIKTAEATINYTLTLDVTRKEPNNRAYIQLKKRHESKSFTSNIGRKCFSHDFLVEACPEDVLNELSNELKFTFEGLPSQDKLSPSLSQQADTTSIHPLRFEINCGTDNRCVDNLRVDFNFTSSSAVKVGIDEQLDVMVSVENREENSYNSRIILTYPAGLSYKKVTALQGRVECSSLDSEDGQSRGHTDCTVDKPIFKTKAKAFFVVSYGIDTNGQLEKTVLITANATSGNTEHSQRSELYKMKEIDVKYSIFVSFASSSSYSNFTFGKNDLHKPIQQSVMISNYVRAFNVTMVMKVPVKLGDKDIWVDPNSFQIPGCQRDKDEEPTTSDFVDEIKKTRIVNCFTARCMVFKCSMFIGKDQRWFNISANLSSGWIEQIGLESAKFLLISTATVEYDGDKYIFFSTESQNNPPIRRIETEVEVFPETDLTKEIVGGTLGGLFMLALITAGLYKAGFFKSNYKQMIADTGGEDEEDQNEDQNDTAET
ncbi:integrin alpha-M-like [Lampris incognitus]|uniref:integrin alpha-M-like n=1 Tax=Lampris incognitus TaxID=2546036 RepID=UPI0024B5EDE4|nr:integrin alpha-M-like [Lampris incognitus]